MKLLLCLNLFFVYVVAIPYKAIDSRQDYATSGTSHITNTYALPDSYEYEEYDEALIPAGTERVKKYPVGSGHVSVPGGKGYVRAGAYQSGYSGSFSFGDPKFALDAGFNVKKLQKQLHKFIQSTIGSPQDIVSDIFADLPFIG
ncbi:uncharacterized protein LOC111630632 [Centruroides sculpturatus]|uniref:uncharacterized protein LOC111630632 n=1 Tax=Centruroides sculpturatus TaxID=218467 RepID=UPI000C6EC5C4|nr:uncharacterized protein LOC111630632 [Centruroides sculpturatus]